MEPRNHRATDALAAAAAAPSLQLSLLQQQPQHGPIVQGSYNATTPLSAIYNRSKRTPPRPHISFTELYFLIAKFLSQGPLRNVSDLIISELEKQHVSILSL